ncbi:uncharacterized protein [Asterias amurensis]|uniref:uncharacterized protein n=1 Tax=Asterias amurensis TaxID=7602 RepID=UPI003AB14A25
MRDVQIWLNRVRYIFKFDGKSSIIIICVMVGSALKLARRRLESAIIENETFIRCARRFATRCAGRQPSRPDGNTVEEIRALKEPFDAKKLFCRHTSCSPLKI